MGIQIYRNSNHNINVQNSAIPIELSFSVTAGM